jgi:sugar-specific transcriptional regulator TrmB
MMLPGRETMLIHEEYIQVLVKLGLTHTQAKVYITLLCLKSATARNIQKYSNVARQDVYRILSELEDKDLIEKIIAKPSMFRSAPPNEAVSILIHRRREESNQLRKEAIQHFRNFELDCVGTIPLDSASKFILLSKNETNPKTHKDKLGKAVDNARKNVMWLINFHFLNQVLFNDGRKLEKAVKRGVKFKFIVNGMPNGEKFEPDLGSVLENADHFKVRWSRSIFQAGVLLVDENEVFCRLGNDAESHVLWSTNPNFVAMLKEYFNMKWKEVGHS